MCCLLDYVAVISVIATVVDSVVTSVVSSDAAVASIAPVT